MTRFSPWLAALSLCMSIGSAHAAGSVTAADVQDMQKRMRAGAFSARAEWNALSFYLQGAMEAIGLAQRAAEQTGSPRVFCPPKGGSMDLGDVLKILEQAPAPQRDQPAIDVITKALQTQHPCKG